MEEGCLSNESLANLRRAAIEARWHNRRHTRKFGEYRTSLNLLHDIRMAAWLVERIRVDGPGLSELRLRTMRAQLLRKLALAELTSTFLLGDPFQAGKGSS